ncbi:MAG: right-handed parallel beta-helix repeat-containing protein [Chitinophagaceae bacterium]
MARGNAGGYVNSELDWSEMWNMNTYGNHVVTVTNYPGWDVRTYLDGAGYPETRRISPAIQENITIAAAGDAVLVGDGTYNEAVTIDKSLTLKGYSGNKALHILNGTGLGINNGITINAGIANVTIEDLTVQNYTGASGNANAGIYGIGANNNLTIDNVALLNNPTASGFYANGPVSNVAISNSTVSNNGGGARGIVIWNGLKQNISITNNIVINNSCCGIELQDGDASAVNVSGNTIDIGSGDNAIGLVGLNPSVGANTVNNNIITGGGRFGIEIKNPAGGVTVSGNQVNMTVQNGDLRDRAGIAAFRRGVTGGNVNIPNGVSITGNTVTGYQQTSVSEGFGIVIEGTNHTVTGNTVTGCDVGILQQQNPSNYPGDADQSNLADIYFGRGNSPTTCGNTISGNTLSNTLNTRDANISGGVVTNTTTLKTYCSIQPAIDDPLTLDGHTLTVQAGTYNESLNINKSLTLEGTQANVCAPARSGTETIINCVNGIGINASGVTLNGFTIQGQTTAAGPGFGYAVYMAPGNTGTKLLNNIIKDNVIGSSLSNQGASPAQVQITCNWFKDNNNPGAATGSGIYTDEYVSGGIFSNVLINNNKFSGNNSAGIDISTTQAIMASTGVTIDGNEFSNNNRAAFLYNVTNSSFTNNEVSGSFFTTSGDVRIYGGVNNFNIANNKFAAGTDVRAIRITTDGVVNNSGITVYQNSFTGYTASNKAIEIVSGYPGTLAATCNWFGTTVAATVAAQVSATVNHVPYLTSGVDASASIGFQTTEVCTACALVATPSSTNVTCPTQADGTASVTLTGGTGPYTYDWGVYGSTATITGLAAGSYPVTVTDINGCTATATAVVGGIITGPVQNLNTLLYYCTIQAAIDDPLTLNTHTIAVSAGTYYEDVVVNKSVTIQGAGAGTTTVSGPIGGGGAAFQVQTTGVVIDGFTITRDGNNLADWNNPGLNTAGVAIQGQTAAAEVKNCIITGNRTGIDVNNSNGNNIHNNTIDNNRTGLIFRNQTDNTNFQENFVTNNWTAGILFLDGSVGTNTPPQSAAASTFNNNNISGNWYGEVVERQSGGSLPAPGTNLKNFTCNWYGTTSPIVTTANSTEPGYAALIPVAFGGGATAPGGQPDIAGPASANIVYQQFLTNGTDDAGTNGFQPVPGSCNGCSGGGLVTNTTTLETFCTIQAAIDDPQTLNGHTLQVAAGLYKENVVVSKSVLILGPNAAVNACSGTRVAEAIVVPAGAAISSGEIFHVAASNVTISGLTIDGDNTSVLSGFTSTNGADIDAAEGITVYETGVNNLTVTNNIIRNLSYFGVTLYDYPAAVPSSGHVISNNKIQDLGTYDAGSGIAYWGGGVLLYNNQYAAVTNNCMTNVRIGVQTGNFHLANPGSTASQVISGNTIEARRRGIFHNLFYGSASSYTLSGNIITGAMNANESVWDGILIGSQAVASTATNNIVNGAGITNPSEGIEVWNSLPAPTVSGGNISGVNIGVSVNNYEGYVSNANNTAAVIDGVTISSVTTAGIKVHDNPLNTNGATVFAEVKNTTITGGATGILVSGADATADIHNNPSTITLSGIGIDADGGTATVYRNNLTANGIGIRATNGGKLTSVTENFITNSTSDGIRITPTAGVIGNINVNDLSGSGSKAINNQSAATLAATCNWYGATLPATVATKIAGPVTYINYLTTGVDEQPGTDGFQNTSCKTVVFADPALVDVNITDLSDVLVNANLLPLNSVNRVHVPVLNLDQDPLHIIPAGTTKIRLDLGNKMILDPSFVLATAPLSAYFTWSKVVESGNDVIYGDQIADLPPSFVGDAYFQTIATIPGTSKDTATFQVTNHNNPTLFLIDAVVNNNGARVNYTVLNAFTITHDNTSDVTCFGGSDGSITVHANGGAVPYQYSIDGGTTWVPAVPTAGGHTFNGLTAGTYTIKARDFLSQIVTLVPNVTVNQPVVLSATVASTNVTCFGANDGTITITLPLGGHGNYQYSINGGGAWSNSGSFTGLTPNTYNVQIRDADYPGCVIVLDAALTITEPAVLSASVTSTNVTCFGSNNGTITVNGASGGYGTYEYRLDAGTWQTGNTFTGLAPATYSVQIRDAAHPTCTIVLGSVTITQPPVLSATVNSTNVTCNGANNGTITISAPTGGYGTYEYRLDAGAWQGSGSFTGLAPATYSVQIRDAAHTSCVIVLGNVTITEPGVLSATVNSTNVTCNGANNGTITISAPTGGYGTYEYRLDAGAWQGSGSFTGLAPATYSVQIRDAAHTSCVIVLGNVTITEPGVLSATVTSTNVLCNGANNGTITVNGASGGYGTYEYRLDAGTWQTSNTFTGLAPATYSVQIRDAAYPACAQTLGSVTITEPSVLNASVTAINHVLCAGSSSGSVTVTATGGTPGYTYNLDGGPFLNNGGSFTGLAAGAHTVVAKDANGCTQSVPFTITEPLNTDITLGSAFDNNIFAANGDEITVVYNITEIAGKAATPAVLRIFKPAGYTVIFDNSQTTMMSLAVDNQKWLMTTSNSLYYEFSRTGPGGNNTINCSEFLRLGFKVKRNTFNVSTFNLNAQFRAATSELLLSNNNNSLVLVGE